MSDTIAEHLMRRYDRLKEDRYNWDSLWEEVANYVLPTKADFVTTRPQGDRTRGRYIFDSTAPHAANLLASHMHGSITNPSLPWFNIRFRSAELIYDDKAQEWLEDCTQRMQDSLRESNFGNQAAELYLDLVVFGTACLHVNMNENDKLHFGNIHMGNVVIGEAFSGEVDTVMHCRQLTARQAAQRWPKADMPRVQQALEKSPDRKYDFVHVIMPIEDPGMPKMSKRRLGDRQWRSYWLSKTDRTVIEEDAYFEKPYLTPRWAKVNADTYGYSPALMARPDIITVNEAKRFELAAWEKTIDPPILANANGIIGDLHLEAGGLTYIRDINGIRPMMEATNWKATMLKSDEIRDQIRSAFLIDQLHIPERTNQTATEVKIRYDLMNRVLGPTMGRIQHEFLNPLVERVFGLMYRAGQFSQPPDSVANSEDSLEVEYQGPLARSQRAGDAEAIERFIMLGMQIMQADPNALGIVDMPKAMRVIGERYGVPALALKSEQEVEDEKKRAEANQKQAQQMMMQQQAAETQKTQGEAANEMREAQGG